MLPRTTLILAVTVSVLEVGCSEPPGGCTFTVESIKYGGASVQEWADEGQTVDKDLQLWVCKNGQLVKVNNQP
jgi:hypothetical protein